MCEVINKLLRPFSYDMIMQDENNQVTEGNIPFSTLSTDRYDPLDFSLSRIESFFTRNSSAFTRTSGQVPGCFINHASSGMYYGGKDNPIVITTVMLQATSPIFPFVLTTIAFRDTGVASRAVDIAAKVYYENSLKREHHTQTYYRSHPMNLNAYSSTVHPSFAVYRKRKYLVVGSHHGSIVVTFHMIIGATQYDSVFMI